jgi:aspartyl-tRNA(Asn)/glutamyl-tRNA(Gln) amidotransferase subunit A
LEKNMDLTNLTIRTASQKMRSGELSPRELVEAHLARIERLDGRLNCFITLTADQARREARQAEAELRGGAWRGPLHGIPLALKDLYETSGVRTTAGSLFFKDYIPQEDAVIVNKLKDAGAVLLGKLNMHEIALGLTNVNPHFGACHNPWDLERVPGGSSGGSAAALAAGLCLGSLGSDTGGSIRVPAGLCGVVGLKPTFGRVSARGVIPLSWNLDHPGPMARSVEDVAFLLQAIAGYDRDDPASVDTPVDDYLARLPDGVQGWRIGVASDEHFASAEAEIQAAVQEAAQVYAGLGAQVQPVEIDNAREMARANGLMVTADGAAFHQERLQARPEDFGADVLKRLQQGAAYTSTEYALARHTQMLARRQLELFFEGYDLLLAPATPVAAPLIEGPDAVEQARLLTRFTAPFNLTGLPAIALPCGATRQGLPIGMQLVARPWDEARLLQSAYAYEHATDWHLRRPVL